MIDNRIAILLGAGFGTRMYPLTRHTAKLLLPVAGRPVIDYLLDQLMDFPQLDGIYVVSNARFFEDFLKWFRQWEAACAERDIDLRILNDGAARNENRRGAVGDLVYVLNETGIPAGALIAAGDNILRFRLLPVWNRFLETGRNYVVALPERDRRRRQRSGVPEIDARERVVRLQEKPESPASGLIVPPLYFLRTRALRLAAEFHRTHPRADAPGHFMAWLVKRTPVYAATVRGARLDIGSKNDYYRADSLLKNEPVIRSETGR